MGMFGSLRFSIGAPPRPTVGEVSPDTRDSAILRARARTPSDIDEEPVMNDLSSMASAVGAILKARRQSVAVAESSPGGLISAALLALPRASAYLLRRGGVYTHAAPRAPLMVP